MAHITLVIIWCCRLHSKRRKIIHFNFKMNKNMLLLLNKSMEFYNSITDYLYKMHIKNQLFVHEIYKNH